MDTKTNHSTMFAAADAASEEAAGFLDETSVAYYRRLAAKGDPPNTKYAASPRTKKNILLTHLVSFDVVKMLVTKPARYTAPWGNRRGPRISVPLVRDETTGTTPADAYEIEALIATFKDPILEPFNKYIRSRAIEHVQEQNDAIYISWFEHNHLPVLLPRTYAANPPPARLITTANSAVCQDWTVFVRDKEKLVAFVHGYRGRVEDGRKDEDDVEIGMLVAAIIKYGIASAILHAVGE
ncbi:hypothetical protein SBRCBS47491_009838 [Sporothrix bragantina]|uniref:Uncharacterized protein n=1 Tax=Sporothrix bragantina TaxID=671064 RepID=A0ABP0D0S1_9PEZI